MTSGKPGYPSHGLLLLRLLVCSDSARAGPPARPENSSTRRARIRRSGHGNLRLESVLRSGLRGSSRPLRATRCLDEWSSLRALRAVRHAAVRSRFAIEKCRCGLYADTLAGWRSSIRVMRVGIARRPDAAGKPWLALPRRKRHEEASAASHCVLASIRHGALALESSCTPVWR